MIPASTEPFQHDHGGRWARITPYWLGFVMDNKTKCINITIFYGTWAMFNPLVEGVG